MQWRFKKGKNFYKNTYIKVEEGEIVGITVTLKPT